MKYMDKDKGRDLLLYLDDVLNDLEIPHFLIQGTALGAYRDNGFVPTELDIDIGVLIEDLEPKALGLSDRLISDKMHKVELVAAPFSFPRTIVIHALGAKADIVGYHYLRGKRFSHTPVDPVNVLKPYALVHDAEILENYDKVPLFGRVFKIPSPIETYLELEYRDWKTPREDHISRSRVYDFLAKGKIDREYYSSKPQPRS